MHYPLSRHLSVAIVLVIFGLQAGTDTLCGQTINWKNDTTGSWFDPANWWENQVPTAANNVAIDNAGDASVPFNTGVPGVGADLNVGVLGIGTLRIVSGGGIAATTGYIGNVAGANGTIIVNGGGSSLTLSNNLNVGEGGAGLLDINAGGTVSNAYGKIGVASTASGEVSVAGATSSWTNANDILIGESGSGILGVSAGATVTGQQVFLGYNSVGDGTASVDGTGSMLLLSSLQFIAYSGTAHLNISAGGTVQSDSLTTASAFVGHLAGASGYVDVSGTGSQWVIQNDLNIGVEGSGTLSISTEGNVSNAYGTIGGETGGSGSATVNGVGSSWSSANDLSIGKSGTGSLSVIEGGLVSSSSGYLGYNSTGIGVATISGAGSQWTNASALFIGYQGTGTLHVTSGGQVTSTDGIVGRANGALVGTVNVNGVGSAWSNSGDLTVGDGGTGIVNITGSGSVDNTNVSLGLSATGVGEINVLGGGTVWTTRGILDIGTAGQGKVNVTTGAVATALSASLGSGSSGNGEANITGDGSSLQVATTLDVGTAYRGKLNVTAGGEVTAASSTLGSSATGYGEVNVDGTGSSWSLVGDLTIGDAGEGLLSMTGGAASDGSAIIASQADSVGTATIFSGVWSHSGALTVGAAGAGILNLTGDGVIEVGATFAGDVLLAETAGSTGTLNIGAGSTVGTLKAGSVTGGDGAAVVNFNHAGDMVFSPVLTGSLSVSKSGTGTTTFAAANSYTGTTRVDDGALNVANLAGSATGSGDIVIGALGTMLGDGSVTGSVEVNGTLSPGVSSVATLSTGSQLWENDGVYEWDIQNAAGRWDQLAIAGDLTIASSLENPFTIALNTLTLEGAAGLLAGFSEFQSYTWNIAVVSAVIYDWNAGQIFLDTTGFANEHAGSFSLEKSGANLNLIYTIPEPSTWALVILAFGSLLALRLRGVRVAAKKY